MPEEDENDLPEKFDDEDFERLFKPVTAPGSLDLSQADLSDAKLAPAPKPPGGSGTPVVDQAKAVYDYVMGLKGRAEGAMGFGAVDTAFSPGGIGTAVADATGVSKLPIWGGGPMALATAPVNPISALAGLGQGKNLEEYQDSQKEFRTENPIASRMAEAIPTTAAEAAVTVGTGGFGGIASGLGKFAARTALGAAGGATQGVVDEVIGSAVNEDEFDLGRAGTNAAVGGLVGGAGAAIPAALAPLGDKAATNRLAQAGFSSTQIQDIKNKFPGGIQGAVDRLMDTKALPVIGREGVANPDALFESGKAGFAQSGANLDDLAINRGQVERKVRDTIERLMGGSTIEERQAGKLLEKRLYDMGDQAVPYRGVQASREALRRTAGMSTTTPKQISAQEFRQGLTGALEDQIDSMGGNSTKFAKARADTLLGHRLQDSVDSKIRSVADVAPSLKGLIGGASGGMPGYIAAEAGGRYSRSIAATTGDLVSAVLRNQPSALGPYAQSLAIAASRGPSALSAAVYTLTERDPQARQMVRELEENAEGLGVIDDGIPEEF